MPRAAGDRAPNGGEARSEADSDDRVVARDWAFDALDALGDGVVVVDEKARLVYRNRAAEELIGIQGLAEDPRSWSAVHGVYLSDERTHCPPEQLPLVKALGGVAETDVELFVRNAHAEGGVHLLVSATPLRDGAGRPRGAACIFKDVTARRKQELQLREAEQQKRAILDNLPDIAWLKDNEGRLLAVNQRFAEAAGRACPEELVGLTDLDIWPRELAERYRRDDADVAKTRLHKRVEEPLVDANGRVSWIETIKTPIVDDDGVVLGTTGIARDITERKRAEEAMRLSREELEDRVRQRTRELAEAQENLVRNERLAVLGQLAGGVAHQIRNPLAAIMNATYVLKRHVSPSVHADVDDAIRIIHDEVRHANVIITGLLDYARVRTPDRHPTSLVDVLDRVLGAEWLPDNVDVVRGFPKGAVPQLDIDANQLTGALTNLVRNAVDAMPNGGTLGVHLDVTPDEITIAISDTGPGISPQVRAHLFEPLHSTKPMGIGLGLVTARRFIEAHGGRITCVDAPVGARFEIRLPSA